MSERDAVFRSQMMVIYFCRVVGELYKFPQHVWLHRNTGQDGVGFQQLEHRDTTRFQSDYYYINKDYKGIHCASTLGIGQKGRYARLDRNHEHMRISIS